MTRVALAIILAAGIVAAATAPGAAAPSKSSSSPPQGPTFKAPAKSSEAPPPAAKGQPAPTPETNVKAPPPPPPAAPPVTTPPASPPSSPPPSSPPSSSPGPSAPVLEPVFDASPAPHPWPEGEGGLTASPGPIGGPALTSRTSTMARRTESTSFEGRYRSDASGDVVIIRRTREGNYYLAGPDWDGVGFFDGRTYRGVFRFDEDSRDSAFANLTGWHFIDFDGDELAVQSEVENEDRDHFDDLWLRAAPAGEPVGRLDTAAPASAKGPSKTSRAEPARAGDGDQLPAFGEYVPVDELPEAITKVAPAFPHSAREQRVDGTVLVQALVLADGTVGDTRIVKSIPLLDDAAAAAVRQWRFKPAEREGRPVAVWVAVPVKFTLH